MAEEVAVFADSYREARDHFLRAARRAGAKHQAYHHPTERGPAGEPLYLDVSVLAFGSSLARYAVAAVSGWISAPSSTRSSPPPSSAWAWWTSSRSFPRASATASRCG